MIQRDLHWHAVALFMVCCAVIVSPRAYADGADPAGHELIVRLEWPDGTEPVRMGLFVSRLKKDGGKRVSDVVVPDDDGAFVWSELKPGRYAVVSHEWKIAKHGVFVHAEITIDGKGRGKTVRRTVPVQQTPVRAVTLRLSVAPDGRSTQPYGKLWYWRHPYNRESATTKVPATVRVKLAADQPYWFRFESTSGHADSEVIGPLVPSEIDDGELDIQVVPDTPAVSYRGEMRATDRHRLEAGDRRIRIVLREVDAEDSRQSKYTTVQPGIKKSVSHGVDHLFPANQLRGPWRDLYDLEDGEYELRAHLVNRMGFSVLASEPVKFSVKDGLAQPRKVRLRLTSDQVGRIAVRVQGSDGGPLKDAPVAVRDGPIGVSQGRTDARGRYQSPPLLTGKYRVLASDGRDLPLLEQEMEVQPGVNTVALSYSGLTTVRGTVRHQAGNVPKWFEGTCYPNADLAAGYGVGNRKGSFEVQVLPDAFPMLVVVYADAGNAKQPELPVVGAGWIEDPAAGPVRIELSSGPVREFHVEVPREWVASEAPPRQLWMCPEGSALPVAVAELRQTRNAAQNAGDNSPTVKLYGRARLDEGRYHAILRRGLGERSTFVWNGATTATEKAPVEWDFVNVDAGVVGDFAKVRAALASHRP